MNLRTQPDSKLKAHLLKPIGTLLAVLVAGSAAAQDQGDLIRQLQEQVKSLQTEVKILKEGPPRDAEADALMGADLLRAKGLSIGFYGEAKYRWNTSGANAPDPHRFVLTPSYQINEWLIFNSELELEHGGVDDSVARGSRFDGEIELEQMYVDILIHDHFNVRSPGVTLIPFGRVNLYHEPTTFYSTERPELYREIIPSTWMEPTLFALFGQVTDTLDYQFSVTTGLQDSDTIAGAGVTAANGMRNARPGLRRALGNALAYSGRLHYHGVPGLDASASFYTTQVQGLSTADASQVLGWDLEAIYRVPNTGLELRGDFAMWHLEKPHVLLENNDATATDDLGKRMWGYHVEAAYHFWPEMWREGRGRDMDLVPFARYTQIETQSGLAPGTPTGGFGRKFLTAGASWFLNPNFVLKADWRRNLATGDNDYYQVGAGVFF